ncbi:DNA-processing protein DprA [Leucobacter albus]|uniref:DNA-processing protein DprA n=1 Tax=Leucobacter albus TaxID=272210 RepID=A0ABW3TM07_9MICO
MNTHPTGDNEVVAPESQHPAPAEGGIHVDDELRRLLVRLCGERELTAADLESALARAVWSRLSEPGDAVAGLIVARLGPFAALKLLELPHAARKLAQALQAAGNDTPVSVRKLGEGVKRWLPRLDRTATVKDLMTAVRTGMSLLTRESPNWPERLDLLGDHAPLALWVRGSESLLSGTDAEPQPQPPVTGSLAVIGARACSGYGAHVTAELTGIACAAGVTIVSGAAYGIDAAAHRTALATGSRTIAVLAGGVDRPYPIAHTDMLKRAAERGSVCSEMVPGSSPTRWRFLQRNRIIAALSDAVLVTEAGVRSGTLNTAGHAAELGRRLGAVPGSVTSASSAGCHRLIREYGATLIGSGPDVLELVGVDPVAGMFDTDERDPSDVERPTSLHLRLMDSLPLRGTRSLEDAATHAGVTLTEAQHSLAELELLGHVTRVELSDTGFTEWRLIRRA